MTTLKDCIYQTQLEGWIDFIHRVNNKHGITNTRWFRFVNSLSAFVRWETVIEHPEFDWSWDELSRNPNITWDIIRNNPNHPWVWGNVSSNPNITWDIVKNNPNVEWCWSNISCHSNITWEIIRNNPQYPWIPSSVSMNPNITEEIIRDNPNYPWRKDMFQTNVFQKMDWEQLKSNMKRYAYFQRNDTFWLFASHHPDITWDFIKSHKSYKWFWETLTYNPAITLDIIRDNPEYPWGKSFVFINPNLLWNDILDDNVFSINYIYPFVNKFTRQLDLVKLECITKWYAANRIQKWWLRECYLNPFHRVGQKKLQRSYEEMLKND